jgi:hypothetical protein
MNVWRYKSLRLVQHVLCGRAKGHHIFFLLGNEQMNERRRSRMVFGVNSPQGGSFLAT